MQFNPPLRIQSQGPSLVHFKQDPIYVFPEMNCATSFPIPNSCICERFIYSQDRSTYFAAANKGGQIGGIKNRSQIHKCNNWERDRAVSFLGICVSNFRYSVFAVRGCILPFSLPPVCGCISLWV
jgi:hypothetical protein